MKTELYTIEALTNLHVGAGDVNFNVIDNQVQRDAISTLPNIHSSSLKGAFREAFRELREDKSRATLCEKYIFGQENNSNETQAGAYHFFEAQLLSRPVRSNKKAYFNATSPKVIENFLETLDAFDIEFDDDVKNDLEKLSKLSPKDNTPSIFEDISDVKVEDDRATYIKFDTSKLKDLLGESIVLFSDSDFKKLDLPVLARNQLENGESKNLWYEEVVPKKSKFFFYVGTPDNLDKADEKEKIQGYNNKFKKLLEKPIQIGANKSIGYGFCKIERVSK